MYFYIRDSLDYRKPNVDILSIPI